MIKKFARIQIQIHYKDECLSIDLIVGDSLMYPKFQVGDYVRVPDKRNFFS